MLEVLPEEARFGIVAYGLTPSRLGEALVAARPDAQRSARGWLSRLSGVGWPDLGAGLEAAWGLGAGPSAGLPADDGADTLVLVSNGQPRWAGETRCFLGDLPNAQDLQLWIWIQSRYRSVVVHTVGIGSGGDKTVLQRLADLTGGRFRNVD